MSLSLTEAIVQPRCTAVNCAPRLRIFAVVFVIYRVVELVTRGGKRVL